MAGKNEVTLTFAGDSAKLESAFAKVGTSAKTMGKDVDQAAGSFDRVGDSTDNMATKTGTASGAFGALASGVELSRLRALRHAEALQVNVDNLKKQAEADGEVTDAEKARIEAAQAEADAAMKAATENNKLTDALLIGALAFDALSGVSDLATLALKSNIVQTGLAKVSTIAHTVASGTAKAATVAWTGAQAALNFVMAMNPIGLVVLAIVALIAIVVLIATKTTWFQDIWRAVWTFVKDKAGEVWDWLKGLPDKIGNAFGKVKDFISAPFKAAFNLVSDAWNNTIGKLSWNVPGWVPGIGGNSISAPKLPRFHSGGVVPGLPGSETLAILQAGERVIPAGRSGEPTVIEVRSGGSKMDDLLVEILSNAIRTRGGNVQLVLGRSRG